MKTKHLHPILFTIVFSLFCLGQYAHGETSPKITSQPQSQTVCLGSAAVFHVGAIGTPPLHYQWKFNNIIIHNATSSTYSIASAATNNAGNYTVVISNHFGSVTSTNAILTVSTPPFIITRPQSQRVCIGSPVTFTVVAGGSAPLSYRWKFNNIIISNATSSTYSIASVGTNNAGSYTVTVSNPCGSITSTNAILTVSTPPTITAQPQSQTVNVGAPVTFTVMASGSAPFGYQWKLNDNNISGATSSTYSIASAAASNAGDYTVVVSNSCGSTTSSTATLTVNSLSCTPAPSGLVSWWQAESNANDSVGTNHGTLLNGTGFASGEVGQAFRFSGGEDLAPNPSVAIPYSPSLVTSNYSVETWINPVSQVTNMDAQSVIFGESYGCVQLVVQPGTNGVKVAFQFGSSPSTFYAVVSTSEIPIGQFSHVAGTWDGTTLRLYINGVLDNSNTPGASPVASGCPFYIGGFYSPDADDCQTVSQFFNGLIDEVSYYNRALTQNEIQSIYDAGSAGKCPPPPPCTPAPSGLVSWWQAESNANDSVGTNNGTLLNGTGFASGEVGQAFRFSGGEDMAPNPSVEIPYSPSLVTSNYSVETWINPVSQVTNADAQSVIFGESYGCVQLVVQPGTNGVKVAFQFGSSPSTFYAVVSTSEIPIGQFSHVAGTWDGTTLRLYINGVLDNSNTPGASPVASGCPFYIGGFYSPDADDCQTVSQFFNGLVDEVSYYNRALTQNEIQSIYDAGSAGKCPP